MKEIDIQNSIRLALNPYAITFRANVGVFNTADGRKVSTGLPKGFSDLFGFRKADGKIFFIEVKNETGRLREDQKRFLESMALNHVLTGVARSASEAIQIVMDRDFLSSKLIENGFYKDHNGRQLYEMVHSELLEHYLGIVRE